MPSPKSFNPTKKQAGWLKHLQGWKASRRSLAAYARSQGLRPQQLYAWRSRLRDSGIGVPPAATGAKPASARTPLQTPPCRPPAKRDFVAARFVPDALAPLNSGVQIRFPNGIVIEMRALDAAPDARLLATESCHTQPFCSRQGMRIC